MSWRFLFAILALFMAASAWGGLKLGEWLVANGPLASAAPGRPELAPVPVLGADGKPFSAQPPQPLVAGRLAIPQTGEPVAWEVVTEDLNKLLANNLIAIATTRISMAEAERIAAMENGRFVGIADVGDLISSIGDQSGGQAPMPLQPVDISDDTLAPAGPTGTASSQSAQNPSAWRAQLRADLQACTAKSFFDRPSCAWAARNKYCTPNNAWGKIDDCPAKNF